MGSSNITFKPDIQPQPQLFGGIVEDIQNFKNLSLPTSIFQFKNEYFASLNSLKNRFDICQDVLYLNTARFHISAMRILRKEIFNTYPKSQERLTALAQNYINSLTSLNELVQGESFSLLDLKNRLVDVCRSHQNFYQQYSHAVIQHEQGQLVE
ncbi:MAG: hypothetical protein JXA94_04320 [Parachlamydiales bacterium]|nr:hypothetical protein [Parachlamydiales bacterium]